MTLHWRVYVIRGWDLIIVKLLQWVIQLLMFFSSTPSYMYKDRNNDSQVLSTSVSPFHLSTYLTSYLHLLKVSIWIKSHYSCIWSQTEDLGGEFINRLVQTHMGVTHPKP